MGIRAVIDSHGPVGFYWGSMRQVGTLLAEPRILPTLKF